MRALSALFALSLLAGCSNVYLSDDIDLEFDFAPVFVEKADELHLPYVLGAEVTIGAYLHGDDSHEEDDIRKLEHIGTHPVHTNQAISNAIQFHNAIGSKRKEDRLIELRNYWTDEVKDLPKVTLNMPLERSRASAIGNIAIEGYSPGELSDYFLREHNIWTGINSIARHH